MSETSKFQSRLSELISLPSISCTQAELDMSNKAVIDTLASWFEAKGFKCSVAAIDGENEKYNLIATLGEGGGGLVLSGHTDTVPCNPERWQSDPFKVTIRDERFYGLGTCDMKGFFAVVLAAVESIEDQLGKLKRNITVIATADEESSMSGARALAAQDVNGARFAIIGEPTSMQPIRMHKGIVMERIRIHGLAGHSSNPDLGHNAIETLHEVIAELLRFRAEIQQRFQHRGFDIQVPTLNLGCVEGGDNPNRICGHCHLDFDLRPVPGMNMLDLLTELESRINPIAEARNTPLSLEALIPGVEPFEQEKDSEIVRLTEELSGQNSRGVAFATEAPFLKKLGMQTVVMGPGSIDQAHQPDEYLAMDQVNPSIETIKKLIQRCCF